MNLLKEISKGDHQQDLKTADGTNAGNRDLSTKTSSDDVKFSMMRNVINSDGSVSGSDVNDYLERAHDLNDEVDTVGFAIETDDGDLIKVYVIADQAEEFEAELAKMLGLEGDAEAAINELAQKFDIVDVVWPNSPAGAEAGAEVYPTDDAEDSLDMGEDGDFPGQEPETTPAGVENKDAFLPSADYKGQNSLMKDIAGAEESEEDLDDEESEESEEDLDDKEKVDDLDDEDEELPSETKKSLMKDIAGDEESEESEESEEDLEGPEEDDEIDMGEPDESGGEESEEDLMPDESEEEELEEPELDADGNPKLDDEGNPIMKKKAKKAKPSDEDSAEEQESITTEEGLSVSGKLAEDARSEISAHVANMAAKGNRGKWYIAATVTGGNRGRLQFEVKKQGVIHCFDTEAAALQEASRLSKDRNKAGAKASFSYVPKLIEQLISKEYKMSSADELNAWKNNSVSPIGSSFLSRVMEAEDVAKLDTSWKGISNRLKRPYEKKIVELFQAIGIPGRLAIIEDNLKEGIEAGADLIRRPGRKQTLFNKFFDIYVGAASSAPVVEAKKRGGRLQKVLEAVLVQLGLPESMTTTAGSGTLASIFSRAASKIDKDSDLQATLIQFAKALGITSEELNEDLELDEAVEVGDDDFFQAVINLALALGIPERNLQYQRSVLLQSLRAKKLALSGRSMIASKMAMLAQLIQKNTRQAATQNAATAPNAAAAPAVKTGALAQGAAIAEAQMSDTLAVKTLYNKIKGTPNLSMTKVKTLVKRYLDSVDKAETDIPFLSAGVWGMLQDVGMVEGMRTGIVVEAFGALEALTSNDLKAFNGLEPQAGPAMMAPYEGGGAHEETILAIAVDPDADDAFKSLRVGIDGPWDGSLHNKYFPNNKEGYKAALDYANMLRTANLKTGGRPKGWKG